MLFDSIIICSYCFVLISLFSLSGQTVTSAFDKKLYLNFINPIIIGLGIFIILLYFSYHILYFSLLVSNIICFLILLSLSLINYRIGFKQKIDLIKNNLIIIFPILIFFIFLCIIYGENFYSFRGNHWDYFYYLSQSILVNIYDYEELIKLNDISNNKFSNDLGFRPYYFDNNLKNIFFHDERTSIFLLLGSVLFIPFKDLFFIFFIYKIFLSSISSCVLYSILNSIKNDNKLNIIISIIYSFSFWNIYLNEIEAIPQSLAIGLFLVILYSYINFIFKKSNYSSGNVLLIFLLFVSFYLIYIELLFLLIFFLIIHSILNLNKFLLFLNLNFKQILIFSLLSISFIFLTFDNILLPVLEDRISRTIDSNFNNLQDSVNLWGYYGSFVLGKDSIISNKDIVYNLTNFQISNGLEFIYKIISLQIENGYKFFVLNIIPSLFGLYHLGLPEKISTLYYLNLIFILFLNFMLVRISYRNIRYFFRENNILSNVFTTSLISSILLILYFLYLGQIFFIIKLYISLGVIIFLFLIYDYSYNQKTNKVYLFAICILVIYKFSIFNSGINRNDSLPSIININYKKDFNWKILDIENYECGKIYNLIEDFEKNKMQWIKYNYLNIKFFKINSKPDKLFSCYISEKEKNFVIKTKN
tara:strand:- start:1462 stop:3396 length:1935 start_codon:yes stop_codon:yes gene_type:complete